MKDYKQLDYYELREEIRHHKVLINLSERALAGSEVFRIQTDRLLDELSLMESHFETLTVPVDTSVDESSEDDKTTTGTA
jgi:hypothetical protein